MTALASLDWSLLRAFAAVMRHGSLSSAARALDLTQPTLGRQIRTLEEVLGEALFDRVPSGLRANARALALLSQAEALDQAAAELSAGLMGNPDAPSGTVRLSSSEIIGTRVLVPILGGLAMEHPEIEIELSISNFQENLLRRDADIAVRLDPPDQDDVIAQRVGEIEVGMFASRAYLRRHGVPSSLADLARHRLVGPDRDKRTMTNILARRGMDFLPKIFVFRSDSRLAQEAAVRAGIGIGPIRTFEVEDDPDLVRVLPQGFVERLPVWVMAHPDMRHARRLRVVYDAVVAGFRQRFK
nr:LysR family transcriptional regulator [uncultured Roseococcus sp.]